MKSSFFDLGRPHAATSHELLETMGEDLGDQGYQVMSPEEIVQGFLERTPLLTRGEQAELLGHAMETQRSSAAPRSPSTASRSQGSTSGSSSARGQSQAGARGAPSGQARGSSGRQPGGQAQGGQARGGRSSGGGFDFGRLAQGFQQGFDIFNQGLGAISQFAGAFGGGGAGGQAPAPMPAGTPDLLQAGGSFPQGFNQIGSMLQALQQGQIPTLPGQAPPGLPMLGPQPAPAPAPGAGGGLDATALLRLLIGNPQLQQAMGSAAVLGSAGPRSVTLPVPGPQGGASGVPIPLGAVMNAIATLANQSMIELNAATREDDPEVPEYLVSEAGEFLVDPASAEERAALVTHYFRLAGEAERSGWLGESDEGLDESDLWAREAGLDE